MSNTVHTERAAKNLHDSIEALKLERDDLDEHIGTLTEALQSMTGEKRGPGRPPGSKNKTKATKTKKATKAAKGKKNWSPEARAAAAQRMKKIWAQRRRRNATK